MTSKFRKSQRLSGFDYATHGAYFVTICIQKKKCLLGTVFEGEMWMNEYGNIVADCWDNLPSHYPHIVLDRFVVMPNHVHGLIFITDSIRSSTHKSTTSPPKKYHGLSEIMRGFKTFSARRINEKRGTKGMKVWQRSFYDHIIRNEDDLNTRRQYILTNPARWKYKTDK